MKEKLKKAIFEDFKLKTYASALAIGTSAIILGSSSSYANEDLQQLTGEMTGAVTTISGQGLIIVGAVIGIAITFYGGKWLWNMFRGWMSRAQ